MTSRYYIAYFYRKARGLQNFSRSYSPPPPPIFSELFRYFELRIVSLAHAMVRHEFRSRYGLALSLSLSIILSLSVSIAFPLSHRVSHHDTIRSGYRAEEEEKTRRANEGWNSFARQESSESERLKRELFLGVKIVETRIHDT